VRGVAGPLIDAALATLDRTGQLEEARRLARRRLAGLTRVAPQKAAPRLRDYLLRRGFAGGVVSQVVRESLRVRLEDDEGRAADGKITSL
jgi:SOS response regulatory protein OraA/RecX